MKKVAVCIPTYQRRDVVREFLDKYSPIYIRYFYDIYIFDSSEDSQTEEVVQEYARTSNHIFYQRIDSCVHSNLKVYGIFKQFGEEQKYDYVWVCGDSVRWSKRALKAARVAMQREYDMIVVNYRDVEKVGTKEYHNNKNRFFLDCAWHMTLYGSTILKCSTMLHDVDWDYLKKKYCVPESINHSHIAFYFERIAQLTSWRAIHLSLRARDYLTSSLKKKAGWEDEVFHVWCDCWPITIHKLPKCYDNEKKAVIKKHGSNDWLFSYEYFVTLRKNGKFNKKIYKHYKKQWIELTNTPRWQLKMIAYFPKGKVDILLKYNIKIICQSKKMENDIKKFCKKYDEIYIYGAGEKAGQCAKLLDKIEIRYEGFIVSQIDKKFASLNGHKIIAYSNELINDKVGIILALNDWNKYEVLESIGNGKVHCFTKFK